MRPDATMVRVEETDDGGWLVVRLDQTDIVRNERPEVACLVRRRRAKQIFGNACVELLQAHDPQYLGARGFARALALINHLQQTSHLARTAETKRMFAREVKTLARSSSLDG